MTEGLTRAGFDKDLTEYSRSENEFQQVVTGSTVEVKTDVRHRETGNLFIEFEQPKFDRLPPNLDSMSREDREAFVNELKSNSDNYQASGIETTEADWWAWKLGAAWVAVLEEVVYEVYARNKRNPKRVVWGGDYNLQHGVLVRLSELLYPAEATRVNK